MQILMFLKTLHARMQSHLALNTVLVVLFVVVHFVILCHTCARSGEEFDAYGNWLTVPLQDASNVDARDTRDSVCGQIDDHTSTKGKCNYSRGVCCCTFVLAGGENGIGTPLCTCVLGLCTSSYIPSGGVSDVVTPLCTSSLGLCTSS